MATLGKLDKVNEHQNILVSACKTKHGGGFKGSGKDYYHILLADDSEDDRFLLRSSIERIQRLKIVAEVSNGTEVIAYFNGLGGQTGVTSPFPDLLLLDLNMPFKDGFQVLEWLRTQKYESLRVVVLTDSVQPDHIKRALDLGADYYQVKARSTSDRHTMARAFETYLMNFSKLQFDSSPLEEGMT
ncbi:MAG TPA: response regulator [Verrucomicrobiae bacterium]|jgi:CheY-like chemotaxis protein|nr:response regulator [Verrucomicrobiae bacterium]